MTIPVKLKRGRQGIRIPAKTKIKLIRMINSEGITVQDMADRIGITRRQLAYPLEKGACSLSSYQKIKAFMESVGHEK